MRVVLGTRGSPLALAQTGQVLKAMQGRHPDVEFVVKEVRTQGDIAGEAPLATLPRGLFAKELELALERGDIDIAVHSFKDLQTEPSPGFEIAAISRREDPRDVLVTPQSTPLKELPKGARLGTSSPRRTAQIRAYRPDLELLPIRGNVGTRITKTHGPDFDGVIVAAAGVRRLGLEEQVTEYISIDICLPAVGQGALAVQVRAGDGPMKRLAEIMEDPDARTAVTAESAVLHRLGGGCRVPIAAFAELHVDELFLKGMVASATGDRLLKAEYTGSSARPGEAGLGLAERLLELGAGPLLEEGA